MRYKGKILGWTLIAGVVCAAAYPMIGVVWWLVSEELVGWNITRSLEELSIGRLSSDYFCYEEKCFGEYVLGTQRRVNFRATEGNLREVMRRIRLLDRRWSDRKDVCYRVEDCDGAEVCFLNNRLGGLPGWAPPGFEMETVEDVARDHSWCRQT